MVIVIWSTSPPLSSSSSKITVHLISPLDSIISKGTSEASLYRAEDYKVAIRAPLTGEDFIQEK